MQGLRPEEWRLHPRQWSRFGKIWKAQNKSFWTLDQDIYQRYLTMLSSSPGLLLSALWASRAPEVTPIMPGKDTAGVQFIRRSSPWRNSDQLLICFGYQGRGQPSTKQTISRWVVEAIFLAYEVLERPSPLRVRAYSTDLHSWSPERGRRAVKARADSTRSMTSIRGIFARPLWCCGLVLLSYLPGSQVLMS